MSISTFSGLNVALRGLLAQQRSIDVTGHNIANVATTGFSRQEAVLSASPAQILDGAVASGAPAHLGSGVDVLSYRRVRDGFLDLQYRAQNTRLGEQASTASTLDRVELSLAEPSENGISEQLARFWDAWSDLANSPDDAAAREAVIGQAEKLGDALRTVDSQMLVVSAQAANEYATLTAGGGEVDLIARELGQLNDSIKRFVTAGDSPNDLMDRRDLLLDRLSELGQVSVKDLGNGSIDVSFGDALQPLVSDTTVTWPQALTTPGGRLGALKAMSEPGGQIDAYRGQLNAVAKGIADAVNAIHGTPFFTYTPGAEAGSLTVAVTAAGIRASAGTAPGGNELAEQIAALRGGQPDENYRAFVSRVGIDVREAKRAQENAEALSRAVDDRRSSVSGVALDEEMSNLVRFQRAYQASSRAMSTMDEMLDVLINRTGRVGL